MSRIDVSIPRAKETRELFDDPLDFLARARASLGDVFVIREDRALFSRAADCAGVVAALGAANQQSVLTDGNLFRMPISAALHMSLPQNLINLNQGLHSMQGQQHEQHQRVLMQVLSERCNEGRQRMLNAGLRKFAKGWRYEQEINLLDEMRRLTLEISTRLLFGEQYGESAELAALAAQYFHARRAAASTFQSPGKTTRAKLVAIGTSLDDGLRRYIHWSRQHGGATDDGLLQTLNTLDLPPARALSEDEIVAHSNVLFMSSLEPTAVTLTWTLLILSQLPELRERLRVEIKQVSSKLTLVDAVIIETLRLLTPNALMTRLTTRDTTLNSFSIPASCEILLSPFLAHREPERFTCPEQFIPERWQRLKPSHFVYLPFGGGAHYCVGRSLAMHMIKTALAFLLQRYDLVLSSDQEVDWKIDIVLLPQSDPVMSIRKPNATSVRGGKLIGPVRQLIDLKS
jgi:cytochrome P450